MARVAGLEAHYVHVDVDFQGEKVNHACAIVTIKDRKILVDSTYNTFDIRHQEYNVLSDEEAITHLKRINN